jgi:hypothetical protein
MSIQNRLGQFASVFALMLCAAHAALAASNSPWIYFADNDADSVNRIRMDGSDYQQLVATGDGCQGLTIDVTGGKLYWSNNPLYGKALLHRSDLNGQNAEVFYEAVIPDQGETIGQLAMDEVARRIYWIDSGADRIRGMNLDGTQLANVLENESTLADALELDANTHTLYFTTGSFGGNTAKVERIQLDGSGRQAIANTSAYSLFLDQTQNRILGADWDGDAVFELVPASYTRHNLFTANSTRDVQRFEDYLVYSDIFGTSQSGQSGIWSRIIRSNLDGSNKVVLREINRFQQPADPIALFVLVPEPSAQLLLMVATVASLIIRYRRPLCHNRV